MRLTPQEAFKKFNRQYQDDTDMGMATSDDGRSMAWYAGIVYGKESVESSLTEARAETAAVLEKAAAIVKKWNFMACSDADGLVDEIRVLIPLPAAEALAEVKRKERLEAKQEIIDALKNSEVLSWQDAGRFLESRLAQLRAEPGAKP